jgi:hypothetical protein
MVPQTILKATTVTLLPQGKVFIPEMALKPRIGFLHVLHYTSALFFMVGDPGQSHDLECPEAC